MITKKLLAPTFFILVFILSLLGFARLHLALPFSLIGIGIIVTPLLIVLITVLWWRTSRSPEKFYSWINVILATVIVSFSSFYFSFWVGSYFYEQHVIAAQNRLETLVPQLDTYKVEHGQYPLSLTEIRADDLLENQPRLMRGNSIYQCTHTIIMNDQEITSSRIDNFYRSNGETYELCFDSHIMFDALSPIWSYCPTTTEWRTQMGYYDHAIDQSCWFITRDSSL